MKAILIYPTPISEIPHSLALIAAVLRQEGYEVHTIINTFKRPLTNDDFMKEVIEVAPDLIGISIMTMQILRVYELIGRIKHVFPNVPIIAGGAHVTDCPEEVVMAGVDIAVRNEGEQAVREICAVLRGEMDIQDVLGVAHWHLPYGEVGLHAQRPRTKDLSGLPSPDFSVFDRELFRLDGDGLIKGINRVYSSRGCPGRCKYCDWSVFGQKVAFHPIADVIDEIRKRRDEYGITNFMIADDCFTTRKEHVKAFCAAIKPLNVKWQTSTRADFTTQEIMDCMADAGCYMVSIGIESGDPETLKRINKGVKIEDNYRAPVIAAKAGMQVITNLMFGFPWETVKSLNNSLDLIYAIWDATYMFQVSGAVIPFPGSQIYKEYVDQYHFKEYWLKEKYQECGVQLYQNALKPYAVSTFYQRNLYDDTFIQEEYFFDYTHNYKKRLSEVIFETGRHNLERFYPDNPWKVKAILALARLSQAVYHRFPHLEKSVGGFIQSERRPRAEDNRNVKKGIIKD